MELVEKLYQGDNEGTENFIDSLFAVDNEQALVIIKDAHSMISNAPVNDRQQFAISLLETFWNFFQSQLTIVQKADFAGGMKELQIAREGFEKLNLIDLAGLTAGLHTYYSALIDIQSLNLNSGLDKIKQAKVHFESIDKYGDLYGDMIEAMEAESLFVSGVNFIAQIDFENAQIAIEKASTASKSMASKYYEKDSPGYHQFMGLGYYYSAFMNFTMQTVKLNGYHFDYFDYSDNEASENSLKALEHLANAIEGNEIARMNLNLAKGINLLSQVCFELGKCMQSLLVGKDDEIVFNTIPLRRKIKNANKFFLSIGDQAVVFIRFCKEIEGKLINVDKFLKYGIKNAVKGVVEVQDISSKAEKLVSNGENEKALEYLIKVYDGYDQYDDIITLKSRHSRLKKDNILGQYTAEQYSVEETKISKSILKLLDLLEG